jgi:hypothetical protein
MQQQIILYRVGHTPHSPLTVTVTGPTIKPSRLDELLGARYKHNTNLNSNFILFIFIYHNIINFLSLAGGALLLPFISLLLLPHSGGVNS